VWVKKAGCRRRVAGSRVLSSRSAHEVNNALSSGRGLGEGRLKGIDSFDPLIPTFSRRGEGVTSFATPSERAFGFTFLAIGKPGFECSHRCSRCNPLPIALRHLWPSFVIAAVRKVAGAGVPRAHRRNRREPVHSVPVPVACPEDGDYRPFPPSCLDRPRWHGEAAGREDDRNGVRIRAVPVACSPVPRLRAPFPAETAAAPE
jgi:hypothetical protein